MSDIVFSCRGLCKSFNGIIATHDVSFDVFSDEIHALIGPNGAGKTTLLSQICGDVLSDNGRLVLRGKDVTNLTAYRRMRTGLSRSFQMLSLFHGMSVLENIMLAIQGRRGHSFRFWKQALCDAELIVQAEEVLSMVHLSDSSNMSVDALSYGECRLLDIAIALAGDPALILLDEPLAGMGGIEVAGMIELLGRLRSQRSILLVEHDVEAVFALADRVSVLVNGIIMVTGTPTEIRSNDAFRRLYLGDL